MSTTRERYLQWKSRCLLPQLPIEIWAEIFSYLPITDLFSIRLVSRLFSSCVNQHTYFWSAMILNIDQCPNYSIPVERLRNISSANIDLLSKSNIYSHCQVYLKAQPLKNSLNKRRKRRLLISHQDEQVCLRCLSVHFQSLRTFDQLQLEYLLKKHVRHLEFSYECSSTEPSLQFLFKLERLKYFKLSFLHHILELDPFALMLIHTMQEIILLLLKLKRLKSLILHHLYLIQPFPENVFCIEHLRSIWLEDCTNIHVLLSVMDKQHLKVVYLELKQIFRIDILLQTVVLRRSTCDYGILTSFLNQLDNLHYLDLASLQIIRSSSHTNEQLHLSSKLKTCSLNNSIFSFYSFLPHESLRSLELIDINVDLLPTILNTFPSLQILCLFLSTETSSVSSIIDHLQYHRSLIHLHFNPSAEDKLSLPSNILILPLGDFLCCFRYENIIF